jgi:Uma2 family endonuclease
MKPKITDFSQLDLSKTYTYADYLTWRFEERVELIKGWIHKMSPAPRPLHQEIEGNLHLILGNHFKQSYCKVYNSPFDVRLIKNKGQSDKETISVVQPDICVVCDLSKIDDRGCKGAPDLIVEVLSTSTMKKDYNEKFNLYQENGIKEYWLANPEMKAIQIFTLEDGTYQEHETFEAKEEIVTSKLFPELTFAMTEVFEYK